MLVAWGRATANGWPSLAWKLFRVLAKAELMDMQEYEQLKQLVESAADDVAKATGGNKAAGTRVRKTMQDVKDMAQTIRKKILEVRSQPTT